VAALAGVVWLPLCVARLFVSIAANVHENVLARPLAGDFADEIAAARRQAPSSRLSVTAQAPTFEPKESTPRSRARRAALSAWCL